MSRRWSSVFACIVFFLLIIPASAQDQTPEATASITVSEQLSTNGKITVDNVVMPQDGWLVINAVVDGKVGQTIGFVPVSVGQHSNVEVPIDPIVAAPQAVALLHADTGEIGKYEFDGSPDKDQPITVNNQVVMSPFRLTALAAWSQMPINNSVVIGAVVSDQNTWIAIRADNNGQPGDVLGSTLVGAGTNISVPLTLKPLDTPPAVLWTTLFTDAGVLGTFEFDGQSGADMPITLNGNTAQSSIAVSQTPTILTPDGQPINTTVMPSLNVSPQDAMGDGTTSTLVIATVTSPVAGWVEVHADSNGHPGKGLGWTQIPQGDSTNVSVTLDINKDPVAPPLSLPNIVWAMVHVDDHVIGTFDHGTTPGADEPVIYNGAVLTVPVTIAASQITPVATLAGTETTPEATSSVTPESTLTVTPEGTTEVTPEATASVTPEGTSEVTPETTITITPEATSSVTPTETETATATP